MNNLPGWFPVGAAAEGVAELVFFDSAVSAADASAYQVNLPADNFRDGVARRLLIGFMTRDSDDTTAITPTVTATFNGGSPTACTTIASQSNTLSSGRNYAAIVGVTVPDLSLTGDIVIDITMGRTVNRCGVVAWGLYRSRSLTATDTASFAGLATNNITIDVAAGGVVVAYGYASANATQVWSGLTERVQEVVEGDLEHSAADTTLNSGVLNYPFTLTVATPGNAAWAAASFR